jgi:hypothetical protein
MCRRFTLTILLSFIIATTYAQIGLNKYVGVGYTTAYAPLRGINEGFVRGYNKLGMESNRYPFDVGMTKLNRLNGFSVFVGAEFRFGIIELRFVRKTGDNYSRVKTDSFNTYKRELQYRADTYSLAYLKPLTETNHVKVAVGASLDYITGKVSMRVNDNITVPVWSSFMRFSTVALTPAAQFYIAPVLNSDVLFGIRPYCQIPLTKTDFSPLDKEYPVIDQSQVKGAVQKSSVVNYGVEFQIMYNFQSKDGAKCPKFKKKKKK